jgi:F-type H+-transporting ATPase subunit alpha
MALTLFAVNNGYFDDIDVKKALDGEKALREFVKTKYASLIEGIESKKNLDADGEKALHAAIQDFKKTGAY